MSKVDTFYYKDNIMVWQNLHSVRKIIRINASQVLYIFHSAIDNKLQITVNTIEKCLDEDNELNCSPYWCNLLPNNTQISNNIYSDPYFSCVLLDNGYYVVASWNTDDVLIFNGGAK